MTHLNKKLMRKSQDWKSSPSVMVNILKKWKKQEWEKTTDPSDLMYSSIY